MPTGVGLVINAPIVSAASTPNGPRLLGERLRRRYLHLRRCGVLWLYRLPAAQSHQLSVSPPPTTGTATGRSPATAVYSPSATRTSTDRPVRLVLARPSSASTPRPTVTVTGWWLRTVASSPSGMPPSTARPALFLRTAPSSAWLYARRAWLLGGRRRCRRLRLQRCPVRGRCTRRRSCRGHQCRGTRVSAGHKQRFGLCLRWGNLPGLDRRPTPEPTDDRSVFRPTRLPNGRFRRGRVHLRRCRLLRLAGREYRSPARSERS